MVYWIIGVVALGLLWFVIRRAKYRRVFAITHFLEVAGKTPDLKEAALIHADRTPTGSRTPEVEPPQFITSAGLVVRYWIVSEGDEYTHHLSVNQERGTTAYTIGDMFIWWILRVLRVDIRQCSLQISPTMVHIAIWTFDRERHVEFCRRAVEPASEAELVEFHKEWTQAWRTVKWERGSAPVSPEVPSGAAASRDGLFRDFGIMPHAIAAPPRIVRAHFSGATAFGQYLATIVLSSCGVGLAVAFLWGLPLPLNLLAAATMLAFWAYIIYSNICKDYSWIELDGQTLRAKHLYTRRMVERRIDEIDFLETLVSSAQLEATVVVDALVGRIRGIMIRFHDGRTPMKISRADPTMRNAKALVEAIVYRMTERGEVDVEMVDSAGKPMIGKIRWKDPGKTPGVVPSHVPRPGTRITREQLLAKIQTQVDQDPETPPVVMLDEYFEGNTDEECIAPNQWGFGRPPLAEFYARFRAIQQRADVQAVLVSLHGDWIEALREPTFWPAAECIHIYTTASLEEVNTWISGLESDGVEEGWPYGKHPASPELKPGYRVVTVFWD